MIEERAIEILKELRTQSNNIVFVCIGTDKHVWDSLGPMVGSMLDNNDLIIYGNLNDPVTSINVDYMKSKIEKEHPDSTIVAIDIAVTSKIELDKKVVVKKGGIRPGIGVGIKNLNMIGDYSILYYVYEENLNNKRIRNPYNGAKEIVEILENIIY